MWIRSWIEVRAWYMWMRIPKPWRYKKYRDMFERMQQAVNNEEKENRS